MSVKAQLSSIILILCVDDTKSRSIFAFEPLNVPVVIL